MTVKRTATGHKGIYLNESTGKYDVKYNYTRISDGEKRYCSKWKCGISTIKEAENALRSLSESCVQDKALPVRKNPHTSREQRNKPPVTHTGKSDDGTTRKADGAATRKTADSATQKANSGVTLEKACELWENKAIAQNLSPVTIQNTKDQFKMITRVLSPDTRIEDIDEEMYYDFTARFRRLGYSEETIMLINGTLRKLINLCFKRRLIPENVLMYCDNIRTIKKEDYRVIAKNEYEQIDEYFTSKPGFRNNGPFYRFLFALLYFTGIRIGEAMALTYEDFRHQTYATADGTATGLYVSITKSFVPRFSLIKTPKNFKTRMIPVVSHPEELLYDLKHHKMRGQSGTSDLICPVTYSPIDGALKRACADLGLPAYHLHEFRHSFISYLISKNIPLSEIEKLSGDTQNTILTRYSHCFGNSDSMVINALEEL